MPPERPVPTRRRRHGRTPGARTRGEMKRYIGERTPDGCTVTVVDARGETRPLDPRHDLRNHSLTGFNYGYAGSGPAQLALALLADGLGDDEKAQEFYQDFKFKVIARLDGDRFELGQEEIQQTVARL